MPVGKERRKELLNGNRGLAATAPQLHEAAVDGDSVQPRGKERPAIKVGQGPESVEEGILNRVLGVLVIIEHRTGNREKAGANGRDEGIERAIVARPQSAKERCFRRPDLDSGIGWRSWV